MAIWPAHTSQAVTICMEGSVLTLCLLLYPFFTAQPLAITYPVMSSSVQ